MKAKKNLIESKPVSQYTLEGEFVKTYNSHIEAGTETGAHNQGISDCCMGKYHSAYGSIWIYLENTWLSSEDPKSLGFKLGKRIQQYNLDKELLGEWPGSTEAEQATGFGKSSITACAKMSTDKKGVARLSHRGYIFIYRKDIHTLDERIKLYYEGKERRSNNGKYKIKKVVCLDLNNNYIRTYDSIQRASADTGTATSSISSCCRGICKRGGDYRWMYEEDYLKLNNTTAALN